jgi:DNA-binding transcriptional LysR family regulator
MDFRQFRTFVIAAEELHFARTAERIGIAQPAVTQQIKALETALGYRLFHRVRRGVELTEAGMVFLQHARQALASAELAVVAGRRASRGELGTLSIGYAHSAMLEPELPALIKRFSQALPEVELQLLALTVQEQLTALTEEHIDVAFLRAPLKAVPAGVVLTSFSRVALDAVLPAGHRLAKQASLDVRALAGERLVLVNDPEGIGLGQQTLQLYQDAGLAPGPLLRAPDAVTVVALVSAGLGIGLVPATLSRFSDADAVFRPIDTGNKFSEIVIATRAFDRSEMTRQLLELARQGGLA